MLSAKAELTALFQRHEAGDPKALPEIAQRVYAQLRQIARRYMAREARGNTLQPTALVNEAFVRLFQGDAPDLKSGGHFFNLAARTMRRILIDEARKKQAVKRGERPQFVAFEDELHGAPVGEGGEVDLLALDQALTKLATVDERLSRVVELRYFAGLDIDETALALECSSGTVKRDWVKAKLWLLTELSQKR